MAAQGTSRDSLFASWKVAAPNVMSTENTEQKQTNGPVAVVSHSLERMCSNTAQTEEALVKAA